MLQSDGKTAGTEGRLIKSSDGNSKIHNSSSQQRGNRNVLAISTGNSRVRERARQAYEWNLIVAVASFVVGVLSVRQSSTHFTKLIH